MPVVTPVSVVMSVRDGRRFLDDAIASIVGQSCGDFEFLIADDGSSDGSADVLDAWQSRDARIRVFHREASGLATSLNFLIAQSRSPWIARMDADDVSFSDRLQRQLDVARVNSSIDVIGGAARVLHEDRPTEIVLSYPADNTSLQELLHSVNCLIHPTVIFRRDLFERIGGYRSVFTAAQDYDLWLRMSPTANFRNLQEPILWYRVHSDQTSLTRLEQQAACMVAAREAGRRRRAGMPDPIDGNSTIHRATLEQWGARSILIDQAVLESLVARAEMFLALGNPEAVTALLPLMAEPSLKNAADHWLRSRMALLSGRLALQGRRLSAAMYWHGTAVCHDPALAMKWANRLVRRGLEKLGGGRRSQEAA